MQMSMPSQPAFLIIKESHYLILNLLVTVRLKLSETCALRLCRQGCFVAMESSYSCDVTVTTLHYSLLLPESSLSILLHLILFDDKFCSLGTCLHRTAAFSCLLYPIYSENCHHRFLFPSMASKT